MPKPEGVPKNQNLFCQNLRRYQKDRKKKPKFQKSWGLETSRILVFLVPPQVLTIFSLKTLPEPEKVPKNQSLEVKILPKPEEVPKKPKRPKFRRSWAWRSQEFWFFWYLLRFWQGFQEKYCQNPRRSQKNQSLEAKILLKPEEVSKKPKIERPWL